jgi:hypothetical protein
MTKAVGRASLVTMLHTMIRHVRPDKVDLLRAWFAESTRRGEEFRQTFQQEGVRHEQAYLVATSDGTLLVYTSEAEDMEYAMNAFLNSQLPIDAEHRKVMTEALAEEADTELIFDLTI